MATNNLTQHSSNGRMIWTRENLTPDNSKRPEMFRVLQFVCTGIQSTILSLDMIALLSFVGVTAKIRVSKDSGEFVGIQEGGAITCYY